MLMKMRSKMQNEKGFTLVELMVVVVILGILVAIAIPVYNNVQAKAEKGACHANLRTIDGMKVQWQMMDTTEQTTVGGFENMFSDGKIPECPKYGAYEVDEDSTDKTSCTNAEHGSY